MSAALATHAWATLSDNERTRLLNRPVQRARDTPAGDVRAIIDAVRESGDTALRKLSRKFDGVDPGNLQVSAEEFDNAESALESDQLAAIDAAITNVRCFHEPQRPRGYSIETVGGVTCERVIRPLDAVGLYVPAGSAPLPSAAIMMGVPAQIANCKTRIMCTPPQADGSANAAVLCAAKRSGVTTVYKIGGAQAIAAMAYGTESVPKVAKVFGPGNAWVTAAKTAVAADPHGAAIDMPAGPSEVLVIADCTADPQLVACDLLAQAEHGPDSQVMLVSTTRALIDSANECLLAELGTLNRSEIVKRALKNSVAFIVDSVADACELSNRYAPEHLIIQTRNPRDLLNNIHSAGSVFLGDWAPETVGDYCSGTNHVLPTYGYARSYSGLSVEQFTRNMTVQELTPDGIRNIGPCAISLAAMEGLGAHARAVQVRLEKLATA